MRSRFLFLTMGLVAALTVVSCSPTAAPIASPSGAVDSAPQASAPTAALAPQPTAPAEPTAAVPTQAAEVQPVPVPTSRGPKLEATDPATVSLASGQLQLVEFFRFT
ncbi:MAG: hypothetical protein HY865_13685 [Chloroflexi bacterium]|nr:hypothetical protein [Chloroflexota bacterium]